MAGKRRPGTKDPANKNTLNRPNAAPEPERSTPPPQAHGTGQFTGEGKPPLQKK
jgi:hypothetical protein